MNANGSIPSSIKTFIISTHHLLFLGLHAILSHVTIIVMANGNGDSHDAIQKEQPRLIIVDMGSHETVTELIYKIKKTVPLAPILLLGGLNDLVRAGKALDLGVDGVVLTVQPPKVLLAAVTALIHSPPSANSVAANGCSAPRPPLAVWPASLTQRERDIVQLVGQGLSNKQIAAQACISVITVRHHLTSIFDKLGVTTRQKLLVQAHQVGMIQPIVAAP